MSRESLPAASNVPTFQPLSSILFLLLAAWLRLYRLPELPPGLNFDEAGSGVAGLDILSGQLKIWWQLGGGQEPLWPYLAALATAGLGPIPLALRLPAAAGGILTVAAMYRLLLAMARGQGQSRLMWQRAALWAALGLALSGWHLHFSRLGFRAILLPLFSALAFSFFWEGVGRRSGRQAILAALFTALAIYTYLAARLLWLVPLLWLGLAWLGQRGRRDLNGGAGLFPYIGRFLLALSVSLSPLAVYFGLHPGDFAARSAALSIFNPAWNQGDLVGTAWRVLGVTLGTFFGLSGDPNPLVNLPGQPALPLLLIPFFALGLLLSLYRALFPLFFGKERPASPVAASPYLFLVCWWLVMLLPALLAPEGAPHHLRLLGAIVPTFALVGLGLAAGTEFVAGWLRRRFTTIPYLLPAIYYFFPAACYLIVGLGTWNAYFDRWPAAVDFTLPYDLYAVRLAGDIATAPPGVVYVLPMDLRAGTEARHYTLDYLLAARPGAPYTYIPVDEASAARLLRQTAAGQEQLRVVRWTGDKHREADAREIITYLLALAARPLERESFPVYDVETYALPGGDPGFTLPPIDQVVGLTLDGRLRLEAAFVAERASPGGWLPVALTLAPVAPLEVDYKVSLRLLDPAGRRLAQKDRVLLHNFHQGTSLWPPGPVNEYYLLPIPPEAPPGLYTVTVVIYHPDTLAPLVADGLAEVPLGRARIE